MFNTIIVLGCNAYYQQGQSRSARALFNMSIRICFVIDVLFSLGIVLQQSIEQISKMTISFTSRHHTTFAQIFVPVGDCSTVDVLHSFISRQLKAVQAC